MKKPLLFIIIISLFIAKPKACHAQCTGNIFTNGSFTSVEGEDVTAAGWTPLSTPDINDVNGPLNCTPTYVWTGTPLASSDGGTWQNIFGSETIQQTVGLVQGQTYTICFEYAAQGIEVPGQILFDSAVGARIYLDGILSFATPDDSSQYTWEADCYTFIASQQNVTIKFGTTQSMYLAIDGACLYQGTTAINENSGSVEEIIISPNPFLDKLNISFSNNESLEIILYDITARKVLEKKFTDTVVMNTENLTKGIYIYEVRNKKGVIRKGKVVKE